MPTATQKIYYPLYDVENIIPILNKIAIFGGLSEKHLYEVFQLLKKVNYQAGEYIYKQGSAPSHIYVVRQGEVKIVMDSKKGCLELFTFSTGDCFGESSVIGIKTHSTNAISATDTELIVLERSALLNIFETDKELFGMLILNIARELSRRLHSSNTALSSCIFK